MTPAKNFIVDPVITEEYAGFECSCYQGDTFVGKRFFKYKTDAEDYGDEWCHPVISRFDS